jgi:integrase
MPLTELQIKNVKPYPGKTIRLFDARGLYIEISETGRRWWRLKYRYAGKEKRLSLGVFPETSLKEARSRCDEARKLLSDGIDPSQQRKVDRLVRAERSEDTFEKIGRVWYAKQSEVWVPEHAARILSRLERDIFPFLGGRPITAIETPELLGVLRRIEARGVRETVRRARQDCEQIFAFAIAAGNCKRNPAAGLSRALAPKRKTVHFPAITDPQKFGELLRTMDGYKGSFTVCCALRLAPLFAVRPGELRKAKWPDFDLHNVFFTPFSIMMYNIHTGRNVPHLPNEEILILVSSLVRIAEMQIPFVFTDQHAYPAMANYYTDLDDLREVDWSLLNRRDFQHDPDDPGKKERYQAEALIWKHLPLEALLGICSCNSGVDAYVKAELAKRSLDVQSSVQKVWYF